MCTAVTRQTAVNNRLPSVSITANGATGTVIATVGVPVSFASQASDPDSVCDGGSLSYEWDFGDGHTSTAPNPTHTCTAAPVGKAKLTVTDRWGGSRFSNRITVSTNRSPVTAFTFSPASPRAGVEVTFTNATTDPDGDPLTYSWTFQQLGSNHSSPSSVVSPVVKFTHNTAGDTFVSGTYNVTLTATDSKRASTSLTRSITVTGAPTPPNVKITVSKRCVSRALGICTNNDWDNTVSWGAVSSVSAYQIEAKWRYCHLWCESWANTTVSVAATSKMFTIADPGDMETRVRALDQYTGKYGDWSSWKSVSLS